MKKITLKENEFKMFLYECVYSILKQTPLLEYLIHRDKFVDLCWSLSQQILENWCLIRYCTLTHRLESKEHWKNELLSYFSRIDINGIKGNNSPKSRDKAIRQGFEYADLFDSDSKIYKYVWKKFTKEGINDKEIIQNVINDFYNSIDDIIHILASGENIEEYVENI